MTCSINDIVKNNFSICIKQQSLTNCVQEFCQQRGSMTNHPFVSRHFDNPILVYGTNVLYYIMGELNIMFKTVK